MNKKKNIKLYIIFNNIDNLDKDVLIIENTLEDFLTDCYSLEFYSDAESALFYKIVYKINNNNTRDQQLKLFFENLAIIFDKLSDYQPYFTHIQAELNEQVNV